MSLFDQIIAKEASFWERVPNRTEGSCWLWEGNLSPRGYGIMSLAKARVVRAHRAAWMIHHWVPIPERMVICHSCDNPTCVNPEHLWLGTVADNNRDRNEKGRTVRVPRDEASVAHQRGVAHHSSKFTEQQVLAIRADKRSLSQLAKLYGVNQATISKIKNRRTYALLHEGQG